MNRRLLLTTFLELENCQENAPSLYSQLKNITAQKRRSCWGILEQKRAWPAWFVPCLANLSNLLPDEHRRNNPHTALLSHMVGWNTFPTLLSIHKDQCFKMPLLQKKNPTRMGTFDFSLLFTSCFSLTVPKSFGKYSSAFVGLNTKGLLIHSEVGFPSHFFMIRTENCTNSTRLPSKLLQQHFTQLSISR